VASAKDRFCMLELGAGWGRWSVYAARLCAAAASVHARGRRTGAQPLPMVADGLFRTTESTRAITTSTSRGGPRRPDGAAGRHRRSAPRVRTLCKLGIEKLAAHAPRPARRQRGQGVSLREILLAHPHIDLVDMDIQGMEDKVIRSVPPRDLDRVRILHIGTHSRAVESRLRRTLRRLGWRNASPSHAIRRATPPSAKCVFEDGVETWVHPQATSELDLLLSRDSPSQ